VLVEHEQEHDPDALVAPTGGRTLSPGFAERAETGHRVEGHGRASQRLGRSLAGARMIACSRQDHAPAVESAGASLPWKMTGATARRLVHHANAKPKPRSTARVSSIPPPMALGP
jgi:hypothetical protein